MPPPLPQYWSLRQSRSRNHPGFIWWLLTLLQPVTGPIQTLYVAFTWGRFHFWFCNCTFIGESSCLSDWISYASLSNDHHQTILTPPLGLLYSVTCKAGRRIQAKNKLPQASPRHALTIRGWLLTWTCPASQRSFHWRSLYYITLTRRGGYEDIEYHYHEWYCYMVPTFATTRMNQIKICICCINISSWLSKYLMLCPIK